MNELRLCNMSHFSSSRTNSLFDGAASQYCYFAKAAKLDESKGHGSGVVLSDIQYGHHSWCPSWWRPIKGEMGTES